MKYKRKPVIVDAIQWKGDFSSFKELGVFLAPDVVSIKHSLVSNDLEIVSNGTAFTVKLNDFIIKDDKNIITSRSPVDFDNEYILKDKQ